MLICWKCLGNKKVFDHGGYFSCHECDGKGHKKVGQDLSEVDKEIKRLMQDDVLTLSKEGSDIFDENIMANIGHTQDYVTFPPGTYTIGEFLRKLHAPV